jgi:hypothetical protein
VRQGRGDRVRRDKPHLWLKMRVGRSPRRAVFAVARHSGDTTIGDLARGFRRLMVRRLFRSDEPSAAPPPLDLRALEAGPQRWPAWLLSMVVHLVLFVALGLAIRVAPRGVLADPDRRGGIALVQEDQGRTAYWGEAEAEQAAAQQAAASNPTAASLPAAQEIPRGAGPSLPADSGTSAAGSGVSVPAAQTAGRGGRPGRDLSGTPATTGIFGLKATGNRFVYVFDRSASMDGFQGRPLRAAKDQLIHSLADLQSDNQFQIIFYNQRTTLFNPYFPRPPKLLAGDHSMKEDAARFVREMTAEGSTSHVEALRLALAMQPDVVFFLTDAGEPQMSWAELQEIRRMNERLGASINAIEFGSGPFQGGNNFLVRLADENNGQHTYVDVTRLPSP